MVKILKILLFAPLQTEEQQVFNTYVFYLMVTKAAIFSKLSDIYFYRKMSCNILKGHFREDRPFSLGGHVKSQENKKLCFCMASLTLNSRLGEASRTKTKLFILNMAAE